MGTLAMMNDYSETKSDNEIFETVAKKYELIPEQFIKRTNTSEIQYEYLIFSTSKIRDDLSQWRAYTDISKGVCIEFDVSLLSESIRNVCINKGGENYFECLYKVEDKLTEVEQFAVKIKRKGIRTEKMGEQTVFKQIDYSDLEENQNLFVRFKNEKFKDEQEIRYFIHIDKLKEDKVGYKTNKYGITRYAKIPLLQDSIKSITLGPEVRKENEYFIEELFCKAFNTFAVKIYKSECPYL